MKPHETTSRLGSRLAGKIVLVTGGTGTFGTNFVRALLEAVSPREVRVFSRNDSRQAHMEQQLSDERVRFVIGDVQDTFSLGRALSGVDVVVHAAALKHVPVCERQPFEAVQTNIVGTMNVIRLALEHDVELVVGLSTDKAVAPVNLYGGTKLVCERLLLQAGAYAPRKRTRFACLRYGNVAASNGSVIHMFRAQSRRNAIRITHPDMTRFWISQDEVVRFALKCIDQASGGEVFVPKLPSVRILELAEVIAPSARKAVVGIRPGEKIHETLVTEEESGRALEFEDRFVVYSTKDRLAGVSVGARACAPAFRGMKAGRFHYSSDSNSWWLTGQELREVVRDALHEPAGCSPSAPPESGTPAFFCKGA